MPSGRSPVPWIDPDSNLHWYDPDGGYGRGYDDDQGSTSTTSNRGPPRRRRRGEDPELRALSAVFSGVRPPRDRDRDRDSDNYRRGHMHDSGRRTCMNIEGPFYDQDYDRWYYYDIARPGGPRRLDCCRHGEVEVVCLCCNGSYGCGRGRGRSLSRSRDRRRRRNGSRNDIRRHSHGHGHGRRSRDGDRVIACYAADFGYDFYNGRPPPRYGGVVDGSPVSRRGEDRRVRHGRHGRHDSFERGYDDDGRVGSGGRGYYDFPYDFDFDNDYDYDSDYDNDYDYHNGDRRRRRSRRRDRNDSAADQLLRDMDRVERSADEAERRLWREYGA
ncbi:hypothetical protein AYO21_02993 [Fonsecaea monophora]|uniref:Uncharacterized protein n=1 Tax=Fonsecaea monophora TaxID=254056 RepID=A0A177FGG8_9EURO|nr:hypothetical protein AYO21_02993 [Fonsecaea monophora]OAG42710.1 hypothetical protein AYO21_02993 [Fonsecaea monophora]